MYVPESRPALDCLAYLLRPFVDFCLGYSIQTTIRKCTVDLSAPVDKRRWQKAMTMTMSFVFRKFFLLRPAKRQNTAHQSF